MSYSQHHVESLYVICFWLLGGFRSWFNISTDSLTSTLQNFTISSVASISQSNLLIKLSVVFRLPFHYRNSAVAWGFALQMRLGGVDWTQANNCMMLGLEAANQMTRILLKRFRFFRFFNQFRFPSDVKKSSIHTGCQRNLNSMSGFCFDCFPPCSFNTRFQLICV